MASGEWFLSIDGQRQGPLDLDALVTALLSQPRPETVMVWRRGYPSWKPAGEVSELAVQLPPPLPRESTVGVSQVVPPLSAIPRPPPARRADGVSETPPAVASERRGRSVFGLRDNVFFLGGRDNVERNVLACVFWFTTIAGFLEWADAEWAWTLEGLAMAAVAVGAGGLGGLLTAALAVGVLRLFRLVSRKIGARRSLVAEIDTLRQSRLEVPSEPCAPHPSADVPAAPQRPAPVPEPPTEPPPIRAQCPWCGVRGRIAWHRRTEVIRCPACQHDFRLGTESGGAIKVDAAPPPSPETNATTASPSASAAPAPPAAGATAQPPRRQRTSAAGWLPAGLIGLVLITILAILAGLADEKPRQSGTPAAAGAGAVQPATKAPAMVGRPAVAGGTAGDRSMEDARRGCDAGVAANCAYLGDRYREGSLVSKDLAYAAHFYQRACDAGDANGCNNLGLLCYNGAGVLKDAAKAAQLWQKACDGGSAVGCHYLGVLYYNGEGVPKDAAKAAQLSQKACDGGVAEACRK